MTLLSEGGAGPTGRGAAIRRMEYPRISGVAEISVDVESRIRALERERGERERQIAGEMEEVRRKAFEKGRQMAEGETVAWRGRCEAALRAALAEMRSAQDEYLARVEHEVVRLALAIAERILHREVQTDPLMLAGGVRAALGRLADSTAVRLRVAATQRDTWVEMLRLIPQLPMRPEVVGDETMGICDVTLETEVGRVDLSVPAQIGEIERSFFDRGETSQTRMPEGTVGRRD
jgi:flagellar assembly protein FliH